MTISIKVSVNGNYKCPVAYEQGGIAVDQVISGFGKSVPTELYIPFRHGADVMTLVVGPETPDDGKETTDE